MNPVVGTFLHRDCSGYALEVTHVFAPEHGADPARFSRVRCRRWGWKDGRPWNDGHQSNDHMLSLRYRGPGAWSASSYCKDNRSELWRAVPGPTGQMGLFA